MPEPYRVHLTWSEIIRAGSAGLAIQVNCLRRRAVDYNTRPDTVAEGIGNSIIGQCGEKAVAKSLGLYWNDATEKPDPRDPDIWPDIQVRAITKSGHRLMIKMNDNEDHVMFLVYPELPTVYIYGWIPIKECKRQDWLADIGNGEKILYAVPRECLRPVKEYAELLKQKFPK